MQLLHMCNVALKSSTINVFPLLRNNVEFDDVLKQISSNSELSVRICLQENYTHCKP